MVTKVNILKKGYKINIEISSILGIARIHNSSGQVTSLEIQDADLKTMIEEVKELTGIKFIS